VKALGLQKSYFVEGNVKTTNIYKEQPFDVEILSLKDSLGSFALRIKLNESRTFTINESTKEIYFGETFQTINGTFRLMPRESAYSSSEYKNFLFLYNSAENAAKGYTGGLVVKPANDQSTVLALSYVTENPKLGSDIVNQLVIEYNTAAIEDKNEINRKILGFINDRLGLVERQLQNVESDLMDYKTRRQVIDLKTQSEMYFGSMSELDKTIIDQEIKLQVAVLMEDYINQPKNRFALVPSTLGLEDPTLMELVTAYNKLAGERLTELQTGATVNNPVIKNLETDIEEARIRILKNLANIKAAYTNGITTLRTQSNALKREITAIPEKEQLGREKARQQEIKQNLYLYLLQKREESEIAQASVISNSRVIDKALPTFNRVKPIPMRVYSIALLVGLILPIVIIYLLDLANEKVTTRADVLKVTDAPVMAEVGHSEQENVLIFPQKSRGIVAEQFRILRSNLRFLLGDKFDKAVIMVTSSFSGEGKSFISTNLGATLAISGKKTVILEFDLRKPKIVSGLGMQRSQGLTNYLVGAISKEEMVVKVPQIDDLYVIPCGPVPPNPSEILLTHRIGELFEWLKEEFDMIVIDTAPVGLVSDALTLSQYADSTLYIIRQRYTFKKQLYFIDDLYRQRKLPRLGLLVNDVITKGLKGYYGYGGGKYGYGYGYGYGKGSKDGYYEIEKKSFWKKLRGRSKKV
jgi:tyrosine-protein kinase Etk/Wzc